MTKDLAAAVLKQMDITETEFKECVSDYRDASAGISGFIYYNETHSFAMENQTLINELLKEQAQEFGLSTFDFIKSFGCLKDLDSDDEQDIYLYLGGSKEVEQGSITNALSWFVVETLAFELDN
jgi:hypothetical protein